MISSTLYKALLAYKNYCKEPAANPIVMFYGLCHCVDMWSLDLNTMESRKLNIELKTVIRNYTDSLKPDEYCNYYYPFDDSDIAYCNDKNKHLNPKRIAFVDRLIAEYEMKWSKGNAKD